MKKLFFLFSLVLLLGCNDKEDLNVDFREEMRKFVMEISEYAKNKNPNFQIITQNGNQLVLYDENDLNTVANDYLNSLDGVAQEDLLFGYEKDDEKTPTEITDYLKTFLDVAKNNGKQVLVVDYCSTKENVDFSYNQNYQYGFISFAASDRLLRVIPAYPTEPFNSNADDVNSVKEAKNFLYLIDPELYTSADEMINDIVQTNYDIVLIDFFFNSEELTPDQIQRLKTKANGGKRLVISYMSIGEAEDYRYYWQDDWTKNPPEWLESENTNWQGNYKVRYWYQDWKNIIYGNENSYLDKILNAGFDGVYLDIIDAFEYFEEKYD